MSSQEKDYKVEKDSLCVEMWFSALNSIAYKQTFVGQIKIGILHKYQSKDLTVECFPFKCFYVFFSKWFYK